MLELTVAMPARNAAPFVREAIASVLAQHDVELALVVVDDASTDDTLAIARSIADPRLTVLANDRQRGIGHCHNRALGCNDSPFVSHVDADDLVVPGALRRMVDALRAVPEAGQAYCHWLTVDASGAPAAGAFEAQRDRLRAMRAHPVDHHRALIVHGMTANALRTYRRTALVDAGPFDERLPWAVDYEMTLRIAERHALLLVPDFLYVVRLHATNTTERLRLKTLRFWAMRARIVRRLLVRDGAVLGHGHVACYALLALGLLHAFEVPRTVKRSLRAPLRLLSGASRRAAPPRS